MEGSSTWPIRGRASRRSLWLALGLVASLIMDLLPTACRSSCEPLCREGFVCADGQCVSACNPPCPKGEMCTPDLKCLPDLEAKRRARPGPCAAVKAAGLEACAKLDDDEKKECVETIEGAKYENMDPDLCEAVLSQLKQTQEAPKAPDSPAP